MGQDGQASIGPCFSDRRSLFGASSPHHREHMFLGVSLSLALERTLWARDKLGPDGSPRELSLVCPAQGRALPRQATSRLEEAPSCQDSPPPGFHPTRGPRLPS